jgi:hypothetical protein
MKYLKTFEGHHRIQAALELWKESKDYSFVKVEYK